MSGDGISIIVPFLNEKDVIVSFCKVIDDYAKEMNFDMEVVFVDDGSIDGTGKMICDYTFSSIYCVKLITLSKNYGVDSAIRAGIANATYDICTWVGCDLQDPLELIEIGYNKIRLEKFDAVYIDRANYTRGKLINNFCSNLFTWLIQKIAINNYSSGGINTVVFNKKVKDFLNSNVEANSEIVSQIIDIGFKHCSISMNYNCRLKGSSKWTLPKKIKYAIDMVVSFSFVPIRLVSIVGIGMFIIGLIIGLLTIVNKIIEPEVPLGYSTLTSILSLGFGITNISLGIIAEYLWRTFDVARRRPVYCISEVSVIKDINC